MTLEMRDGKKCICVFECAFCPGCVDALQRVCPECVGGLVHRPEPQRVVRGQVVA